MALNGSAPTLPQMIVIGTAVTASLGSTMFLKLMSFPYVTKLEEIRADEGASFEDRTFLAYRISMLGSEYGTEVALGEVQPVKVTITPLQYLPILLTACCADLLTFPLSLLQVTEHPFASFQARGEKFFVFHKMVNEEKLQDFFLAIQENKVEKKSAKS